MSSLFLSSVTRVSDLSDEPYECVPMEREQWATGDYVMTDIVGEPSRLYRVELADGRVAQTFVGDRLIGALGHRAATLEAVGSWRAVEADGALHALTGGGLLGRCTSLAPFLPEPMALRYRGHVQRAGRKVCMADFAVRAPDTALDVPVVLLVGTSMSAGKTTLGRLIVHDLADRGLHVIAAKLTGAGRFHDVLSYRDAGATEVFDFVDAGLPSTIVPQQDYLRAVRPLISHIALQRPDVLVLEAGASPLEPYNGRCVIEQVTDAIRCICLCASDPYAVAGVASAFGLAPDLVSGPATNTSAARELVDKLTGFRTLNAFAPEARHELAAVLERSLALNK